MFPRRTVIAVLLFAANSSNAAAANPAAAGGERPLTTAEQAASDRKLAAAAAYIADVEAQGQDLVGLDCVTPSSQGVAPDACAVPQGFLPVEARDQTKSHYCGPAVGQVIANYSWKMASGANKYAQAKIAGWMQTDVFGGTSAPYLRDGLETATRNSPRRPAGFVWVVTDLRDADRSGSVGDDLQDAVRANVSGSRMPLGIPVKPHDPGSGYHLVSWPFPVKSPGHWIAVYGWFSPYTGNDFARIYFTDSSRDEGGSTGKFWDPTRHIAILILEHTRRFVW
jgi:hypothetical protein